MDSEEPAPAEEPTDEASTAEEPVVDVSMADVSVESKRALEAIILVASDPVPTQLLAQLLELSVDSVDRLCRDLAAAYDEEGHGFQLVEVAGGWRYQTHPDLHPYVERYAMDGQSIRLSSAALETLAIVAYKQPISRAQVSAIRGVSVDAVLRTLEQRGYVEEVGRDTGVGQAVLFGTTPYFLERVGVNTPDELPSLGDFVPAAEVVEALEQTLKVELEVDPELADGETSSPADENTADDSTADENTADENTADENTADGVAVDEADADEVIDLRDEVEPESRAEHDAEAEADVPAVTAVAAETPVAGDTAVAVGADLDET